MEKKLGFLEIKEADGTIKNSSSRLNASIMIWVALLLAIGITLVGALDKTVSILAATGSAVSTFLGIGGTATYFLFNQKKTEEKSKVNDKPTKL